MKKLLLSLTIVALASNSAFAAVVLTQNFESPVVAPSPGHAFFTPAQLVGTGLEGWTSNTGAGGTSKIEIWAANAYTSPAGSTQNLEINSDIAGTVYSPDTVPAGVVGFTNFVLTFDAWVRGSAAGVVNVIINGNSVATQGISANGSTWTGNVLAFAFNDVITSLQLTFTSNGDSSNSVHIDNVALAAVPEPTTIVVWGGLAAIGGVVAYRRKKLA